MPAIIWSSPRNPPSGVATRLGITRQQLRDAIHEIKHDAKLAPTDRVTISDDGSVRDENDVEIGNVYEI